MEFLEVAYNHRPCRGQSVRYIVIILRLNCYLKNYFSSNEKIFQTLFTELRSLKISDKYFLSVDKINGQYFGYNKLILLILFPLFAIKDNNKIISGDIILSGNEKTNEVSKYFKRKGFNIKIENAKLHFEKTV